MLTTFKFHLDWHGGCPVWYVVVSFARVDLVILTNNFWSSKATAIGMCTIFGYVVFITNSIRLQFTQLKRKYCLS